MLTVKTYIPQNYGQKEKTDLPIIISCNVLHIYIFINAADLRYNKELIVYIYQDKVNNLVQQSCLESFRTYNGMDILVIG